MRLIVLVVSSLWLSAVPARVPFLEVTPETSPWWAAIAVVVAGLIAEIVRRFITAYLKKLDAKRQFQFDAKLKVLDDEEDERKRRFDLEMARIAGQQAAEQASSQQIGALTSSIYEMARSVTQAHLSSSDDRQRAAAERAEFRTVLSGNSDRLGENTGELAEVRKAVDLLAEQVNAVHQRIGQSKDERTLMQIAEELVTSVQEAVITIRQASDGSSPRLPVPPPIHLVPPSEGGKPHLEEAHETPGS